MKQQRWKQKFAVAFRGIGIAVRGENSFVIHFLMTAAVLIAAVVFRATLLDFCVLCLCITVVLTAETFNSALENLAKAITDEHNEYLGRGLDAAAGAVLMAAMGAAVVGALVFLGLLGIL